MPRKKSIKSIAKRFQKAADEILEFVDKTSGLKEQYTEWCSDYAIIRLYREFENLMLGTLSGAINNDAATISTTVGITFPKHMSDGVCRYLVVGTGYFDFRGRDGLIRLVKEYVPDTHYLVGILKDAKYKDALEQLSALRNLAAHGSEQAKAAARKATGNERIGSAGSWLRQQTRYRRVSDSLTSLAHDIETKAPY
jgi:hypothetical protein